MVFTSFFLFSQGSVSMEAIMLIYQKWKSMKTYITLWDECQLNFNSIQQFCSYIAVFPSFLLLLLSQITFLCIVCLSTQIYNSYLLQMAFQTGGKKRAKKAFILSFMFTYVVAFIGALFFIWI